MLVAFRQWLQVIYMIVVVAWRPQNLKGKIANDGRSSGKWYKKKKRNKQIIQQA